MELNEEIEVCFLVQAKNCLTGDLYDCPGALVQFGGEEFIERSVLSTNMTITDPEGIAKIMWRPMKDTDYLRAMINKPDGELIDKAKFDPEIKDIRRTILEMIYKQTDGDHWNNNENWMSDKPLHHWKGVEIGLKDTLWINLSENNLKGSIDISNIEGFDKSKYPQNIKLSVRDNQLTSINLSEHDIVDLDCSNNQLTSLNVSGCTALEALDCTKNQLTSLNVSGCTALEAIYCSNNKITSVIPDWFSQLINFDYDIRYTNYWWQNIYWDGHVIDRVLHYDDNGTGWWYPGEPSKGYHGL